MAENTGGVRPASNGPASATTVAEPTDIRPWRPDPRHVKALDRHITSRYGPEYVRGRAA
jgi:hypothetical protein